MTVCTIPPSNAVSSILILELPAKKKKKKKKKLVRCALPVLVLARALGKLYCRYSKTCSGPIHKRSWAGKPTPEGQASSGGPRVLRLSKRPASKSCLGFLHLGISYSQENKLQSANSWEELAIERPGA